MAEFVFKETGRSVEEISKDIIEIAELPVGSIENDLWITYDDLAKNGNREIVLEKERQAIDIKLKDIEQKLNELITKRLLRRDVLLKDTSLSKSTKKLLKKELKQLTKEEIETNLKRHDIENNLWTNSQLEFYNIKNKSKILESARATEAEQFMERLSQEEARIFGSSPIPTYPISIQSIYQFKRR